MNAVRIKFCGLTRPQDVQRAAELGADAVGLVCVPQSKRYVAPPQLQSLVDAVPPFVERVALFQNATAQQVREVLSSASFSLLQFHGAESPEFCRSFGLPYIKAIAMADSPDLEDCACKFVDAKALLLDSHSLVPGGPIGGTGHGFDYAVVPKLAHRLIIAGGLRSESVALAIQQLRPWAVDVSSGIESAPGIKDAEKMQAFVEAVRNCAF